MTGRTQKLQGHVKRTMRAKVETEVPPLFPKKRTREQSKLKRWTKSQGSKRQEGPTVGLVAEVAIIVADQEGQGFEVGGWFPCVFRGGAEPADAVA